MKVAIKEGTDTVESLNIYYGGVGPTLVKPRETCQQLVGRYVVTGSTSLLAGQVPQICTGKSHFLPAVNPPQSVQGCNGGN